MVQEDQPLGAGDMCQQGAAYPGEGLILPGIEKPDSESLSQPGV